MALAVVLLICKAQDLAQSPIERTMVAALIGTAWAGGAGIVLAGEALDPEATMSLVIEPQARVGKYRADFIVSSIWKRAVDETPARRIVLECDGHAFHERTPEQAKRDRRRDRVMQADGFLVMRFTGSEIHADARRCSVEVLNQLAMLYLAEFHPSAAIDAMPAFRGELAD